MPYDVDVRKAPPAEQKLPRLSWLRWPLMAAALLLSVQAWSGSGGQQQGADTAPAGDGRLVPTEHPPVPPDLDAMWFAPSGDPRATSPLAGLARGVDLLESDGSATEALPLLSHAALAKSAVAPYAKYYTAIALDRLGRREEADAAFAEVAAMTLQGQLPDSARYRRAEIRESRNDYAGAVALYEEILARPPASPAFTLMRLGSAAAAAGDRERAMAAYRRVLSEHTLSAEAAAADRELERLGGFVLETPAQVAREYARGEALFKARKYDQAQRVFDRVKNRLEGLDKDRVTLHLASIQASLGQHRQAREIYRGYLSHPILGADAQFGIIAATRALKEHSEANELTEEFVARHPQHPAAEEALNEMARHFVLDDDDETAARIYRRMVDRFPNGAFAQRGAWKAGWWAYRNGEYPETIRVFERAAAVFPRSDYRPSWLYWTARAYEHLGDRAKAVERYRLTATDYLNSYYGRLAWSRLERLAEATVTPGVRRVIATPPSPPPNRALITALIEAGLYRPALSEVQYAQRVWGDSAPLQATLALVHNRMGNLRLGINAMRRAYPQFLAAGGEELPRDILRIIFPLDYWPLLEGHARANGIDPFVLAALAAQESTFDPEIRSPANAVGLLQIIPPTGRRLARRVGMKGFTERALTNPEINAKLGARYFGDMYKEFGGYHFALAGYNAGEHRVKRWNSEAPGLPQDEWIDNIPYFETQNYVKRILGTAEDYRRLYGDGRAVPAAPRKSATAGPAVGAPAHAAVAKAPAKKAAATKAPAKKAPVKKAPAKKPSAKKVPAKKPGA